MKRLNTHIGSLDGTFQQRPKIFHLVGVDRAVYISFGMVNNLMSVFIKAVVRLQRIGIESTTRINVLADLSVKVMLPARTDYRCTNLASFAFKQAKNNRLAHWSAPANLTVPFIGMHKP